MARTLLLRTAVLAAALVAAHAAGEGAAFGTRATSYAELKPYAGQWDIAVATSATAGAPYEKDMCTEPAGCLPALGADQGSSLRITLTRVAAKNATAADGALSTLTGGAPVKLTLKACFSKPSTADRPWRRAAPVVDKDRSCPVSLAPPRQLTAAETAVGAPPLVFDFKVPKNAPKAAWYASAMLECADKQLCQHETTNGTAFWQTQAAQSRPASLIAAASVCSAVAPGMLALFFVRDHVLGRAKK